MSRVLTRLETVKSSLCYVTKRVERRTRTTVQGVAPWPAGDRPVGETEDEKTGMQHVGHHSPTWEAGRNRPAVQPRIDVTTFAPLRQHCNLDRVGLVATRRRPITEFSRAWVLIIKGKTFLNLPEINYLRLCMRHSNKTW